MNPKIVAIIQGRMSSSRLPGKILADIAGQPMLTRVFSRTSRARTLNEVIFATTTDASDDPVAEYCDFSGIPYTRGSLFDVLDRYYQAALQAKADVVVRVTADCPVIDPQLIDDVVTTLLDGGYDFVCNRLPAPWTRTYPIGLDVEACTFEGLKKTWAEAKELQHREHAMPYFYEGVELTNVSRQLQTGISPRGFKVALLHHTTDFGDYRWTVDTAEDLDFMCEIYDRFDGRDDFSWKDVLDLVHNEPHLMEINADIQHKTHRDVDKRALK
ncbi:MAG: glycosyltransferase family protein [Chloroflexi bacterium]|nr:glycosyltransferase family protein [Chloroflexota bacterium]